MIRIRDTADMEPEHAALTSISGDAPSVPPAAVAHSVEAVFGLTGEYTPLVSERDQNFMLRADGGDRFVVKVTGRYEDPATTDFQIAALRYLENANRIVVPRVRRTVTGETSVQISDEHGSYRLRVVSWVDGDVLESRPFGTGTVSDLGTALAHLDRAFAGFTHPGQHPVLLWDLQRAVELREVLESIDDLAVRSRVVRAVDDFAENVLPVLDQLRSQVIHSDANPGNALLTSQGIGFIDFGDIIKAPLVFDVAIAASYLRSFDSDPLRLIVPFVTAYHAVMPLNALEADLLFDLVRARLATTVTLLHWRLAARDRDDPYRQKALDIESGAERFLDLLDGLGREAFRRELAFIQ